MDNNNNNPFGFGSFGISGTGSISANEILTTKSGDIDINDEEIEVVGEGCTVSGDGKISISSNKKTIKKGDIKVSTSLAVTSGAKNILDKVYDMNSAMKANTIINMVLESNYNPETKTFNVDIPVKEDVKNVNISIQIAKKHRDALNKEAKKKNMTAGEYLSEILTRKITLE